MHQNPCVAPVCPTDAIEWGGPKTIAVCKSIQMYWMWRLQRVCPRSDIISYMHNEKGLEEVLPECIELGAENIELHAAVAEDEVL